MADGDGMCVCVGGWGVISWVWEKWVGGGGGGVGGNLKVKR